MDKNDSKRSQREGGCPVLAFQKMVSGKYKIRILWDLKDGARRYGEIRSGLLRGVVGTREIAPRKGRRFLPVISGLRNWGAPVTLIPATKTSGLPHSRMFP